MPRCSGAVSRAETPGRGIKKSLVRFIHSVQLGQPNYEEMGPQFVAADRSQASRSGPLMKSWGPLKSITFGTANAQGCCVYGAAFQEGLR